MWWYTDKESPILNTCHSLFNFENPSNDTDGLGKYERVIGYSDSGVSGKGKEEPWIFKLAEENCYNWKKVKTSTKKEVL